MPSRRVNYGGKLQVEISLLPSCCMEKIHGDENRAQPYLFAPSDHFEIMLEIEIISEIMFEVIFVLK